MSNSSAVLYLSKSDEPVGFYVVPLSEYLHGTRAVDYILLNTGSILSVDLTMVDPAVKELALPFRFGIAEGTPVPLVNVMWKKAKCEVEDTKKKLRPSFTIDCDNDDTPARRSTGRRTDSAFAFAEEAFLYPYNSRKTQERADRVSNESSDDGGNDSPKTRADITGAPDSCASILAASKPEDDGGLVPSIAVVSFVTELSVQGHYKVIFMHVPPLKTSREPVESFVAALRTLHRELKAPLIGRVDDNADLKTTHCLAAALPENLAVGSCESHQESQTVVIGADNGGHAVYRAAQMELFVSHSRASAVSFTPTHLADDTGRSTVTPLRSSLLPGCAPFAGLRLASSRCSGIAMELAPKTRNRLLCAVFNNGIEVIELSLAGHHSNADTKISPNSAIQSPSDSREKSGLLAHEGRAVFRVDPGSEQVTGCFHPVVKNLLLFIRDGAFCWVCTKTLSIRVIAPVQLTEYELSRKASDGDLGRSAARSSADGVETVASGTQHLAFSADGLLLLRFNALYGCASVYSWPDIHRIIRRQQESLSCDTSFADVSALVCGGGSPSLSICTSHNYLRAHLSRTSSQRSSVAMLLTRLQCLIRGIHDGRFSTGFRDADGRSALHLAFILSDSTDPSISAEGISASKWLLEHGASAHVCDKDGLRPLDIALGKTGSRGTGGKPTLPSMDCLLLYRRNQSGTVSHRRAVKPIAELAEPTDQAVFSAVREGLVYFVSSTRQKLLAIDAERDYSVDIASFPRSVRVAVFPHSSALHGELRDRDFLLASDGTLMEICFSLSDPGQRPQVNTTQTSLHADVSSGTYTGCCLGVSAIRDDPRKTSVDDYAMGVIASAWRDEGSGRWMYKSVRVSSVVYPASWKVKTRLTFLKTAIDLAWCAEKGMGLRTSGNEGLFARGAEETGLYCREVTCPPLAEVSAVTAGNSVESTDGWATIFFEESVELVGDPRRVSTTNSEGTTVPREVIGLLDAPDNLRLLVSKRSAGEGLTSGAAMMVQGSEVCFARFSRSVELYKAQGSEEFGLKPGSLLPVMDVPGGDDLAENTGGCFHPAEKQTLVFFKEGDLCVCEVSREESRTVSRTFLSVIEVRRKCQDGDEDSEERVTGLQEVCFSASGVYLLRFNRYYKTFVIYAWADVARAMRRASGATCNLVTLPTSVDPSVLDDRPPRRTHLKGNLQRLATRDLSVRENKEELSLLLSSIEKRAVEPNFVDGDRRTALHIACELLALNAVAEETSFSTILCLLRRGANLYVCDNANIRPIDHLFLHSGGKKLKTVLDRYSGASPPLTVSEPPVVPLRKASHPVSDRSSNRLVASFTPDDNMVVEHVSPSATNRSVFFAIATDRRSTRGPFGRQQKRGQRTVYSFNVDDHRIERVAALDTSSPCGLCVVPYSSDLHGGGGIDFLFCGAVLYSVKRSGGGSVADTRKLEWEPGNGGPMCVMWTPVAYRDEACSDVLGSICRRLPTCLEVTRLPNVDKCDNNTGKFLALLVQLGSKVRVTVATGPSPQICCAWFPFGGVFFYQDADETVKGLTYRGEDVVVQESDRKREASNHHQSTLNCCSYDGQGYVVISEVAGFQVFVAEKRTKDVADDLDAEVGVERNELDITAESSPCVRLSLSMRAHDAHSNSRDLHTAAFHPSSPHLLLLFDNELVSYNLESRVLIAVCTLGPSRQDLYQRTLDGDTTDDVLVGSCSLRLSCDGSCLAVENTFYASSAYYDWKEQAADVTASEEGVTMGNNAVHLEGLSAQASEAGGAVQLLSRLQRERRGNGVRKEEFRGYLGRLKSWADDEEYRLRCLESLLSFLRRGIIAANFRTADDQTALHLVCSLSRSIPSSTVIQTVSFLLKLGASPLLCDSFGSTPVDLIPVYTPSDTDGCQVPGKSSFCSLQSLIPEDVSEGNADVINHATTTPPVRVSPTGERQAGAGRSDSAGSMDRGRGRATKQKISDIPPALRALLAYHCASARGVPPAPPPTHELSQRASQLLLSPTMGRVAYIVTERSGTTFVSALTAAAAETAAAAPFLVTDLYSTQAVTATRLRLYALRPLPGADQANPADHLFLSNGVLVHVRRNPATGGAGSTPALTASHEETDTEFPVSAGADALGFAADGVVTAEGEVCIAFAAGSEVRVTETAGFRAGCASRRTERRLTRDAAPASEDDLSATRPSSGSATVYSPEESTSTPISKRAQKLHGTLICCSGPGIDGGACTAKRTASNACSGGGGAPKGCRPTVSGAASADGPADNGESRAHDTAANLVQKLMPAGGAVQRRFAFDAPAVATGDHGESVGAPVRKLRVLVKGDAVSVEAEARLGRVEVNDVDDSPLPWRLPSQREYVHLARVTAGLDFHLESGAHHPLHPEWYLFCRHDLLYLLHTTRETVTRVAALDIGPVEAARASKSGVSSAKLLHFTGDGQALFCLNVYEGVVARYEWQPLQDLIEESDARPAAVDNAVILPSLVGGFPVSVAQDIIVEGT
ncbi:hypothetical protein DIPPA_01932 [Diplonema papillatum]|nr:hypothetical protein DIPPA_01932 [Diplonema papillatum]